MKNSKREKNKSLGLGVYFGFLVILIILISIVFKGIDIVRRSSFDGNHRFTVAVLSDNNADLISVSPSDGTLTHLRVGGVRNLDELRYSSLPIDGTIESKSSINAGAKSYFSKALFSFGKTKTDLTVIDLARLSIYSEGVDNEKVDEESISIKDEKSLSKFSSSLFVDPSISEEKVSIQITNATGVSGLGNQLAKYISNMGGNVLLVNSSQQTQDKSEILYTDSSYTQGKLSKILGIASRKKEMNSISDIIIVIGKDKEKLFQIK